MESGNSGERICPWDVENISSFTVMSCNEMTNTIKAHIASRKAQLALVGENISKDGAGSCLEKHLEKFKLLADNMCDCWDQNGGKCWKNEKSQEKINPTKK